MTSAPEPRNIHRRRPPATKSSWLRPALVLVAAAAAFGVVVMGSFPSPWLHLVAVGREELELGLHRNALGPGLGPQRWQLLNVVVLCGLLALTVPTGAYSTFAVLLPGLHPILPSLFFAGLLAFVVLALLPLRNVRAAPTFWWRRERYSW